jgi:hypothetical protein
VGHVTTVNTSKQITTENAEGFVRVRLFLVGLPSDYESWQRAFELVVEAAAESDPSSRFVAARTTTDADLVIEVTIPYAADPDEILSSVDALIQEADARCAVMEAEHEAIRSKVQDWWAKRAAQS